MKRSTMTLVLTATLAGSAMAQVSAGQGAGVGQGVRRGWFGVQLSCEDCFIQRFPGRVAYIQRPAVNWVESGSPAYQAGLRSGDTLTAVNGQAITTPEGFEAFANAVPGTPVRLTLRRDGQDREVTVTPIDNNSSALTNEFYMSRLRIAQRRGFEALRSAFRSPLGWLGMGLECEQCSVSGLGRRSQNFAFRTPPAVLTVDVDGPAHRAALRRGDTLTTIDGIELTTPQGGRAFAAVEPGQRVTLGVRRGGVERHVVLVAVARPDASSEELAAYQEYKRSRDSADVTYRELVTTSVARAQTEIRALEAALRDMDASRTSADSTRRRFQTMDSLMRLLRSLERRKYSDSPFQFDFTWSPSPRAIAIAPMPPMPPMPASTMLACQPYSVQTPSGVAVEPPRPACPLRYSGRLGTVNIEARGVGAVNTQEMGDSVIVVNTGTAQVKVYVRSNP